MVQLNDAVEDSESLVSRSLFHREMEWDRKRTGIDKSRISTAEVGLGFYALSEHLVSGQLDLFYSLSNHNIIIIKMTQFSSFTPVREGWNVG